MTEVCSPPFGATFSTVKVVHLFDKKWFGLHFGLFFINSSGHPVCVKCLFKEEN
jgi:hypothetical protein